MTWQLPGINELQKKLRNLQWKALYYMWRRVLLGRFHITYWPCFNNDKTNKSWWLFRARRSTLIFDMPPIFEQWSSGWELPEDRELWSSGWELFEDRECPFRIGRPFRIVIRFLGHKTNRAFFNRAKSRRITCCWRNMLLALCESRRITNVLELHSVICSTYICSHIHMCRYHIHMFLRIWHT